MWLCHNKRPIVSEGLWLEDSPVNADLPLLSIQIILVIVISTTLSRALRPLGIPIIVSQMLTGIILGPSALGRLHFFKDLFSPDKTFNFKTIGLLGLTFFKFLLGVKIEMGMIRKSGGKALVIGLLGYIVPVGVTFSLYYSLGENYLPIDDMLQYHDLFNSWSFVWSESSLLVVACLLDELNLLNSKIGRLAVGSCLIQTTLAVFCRTMLSYYLKSRAASPLNIFFYYSSLIGLIIFVAFVARPVGNWMVRRTPKGEPLAEGNLIVILIITLICGFYSGATGVQAGIGMFYLGLALPSGPPLGSTLVARLEGFITTLCFPVFVVMVVLVLDFSNLFNYMVSLKNMILLDLFINFIKFTVAIAPALYFRMPFYDILALLLILSSRGIAELSQLFTWEDTIPDSVNIYTILLFQVLFWATITGPLIKFLYKPSNRYLGYKRRTIPYAKNNVELRVMTCIHTQEQVPHAINLLETLCAGKDNPICIYALHLIELVGRVATVLLPYYNGKNSSYATDTTEHIIAAFQNFEQKMKNLAAGITLQPFISLSPYGSMYEDVCTLALDKKMSMIILPFHKMDMVNGTIESTNQALQAVNTNVLTYAPCTVAIFVHQGDIQTSNTALSNLVNTVVMYFFGGGDDREGLALAIRMASNPRVNVKLVRFMSKVEETSKCDDADEKLDNEMVYEYRVQNMNIRKNMEYQEEVLEDHAEVVNIIKSTNKTADLLIVGRREGKRSMLVMGLSEWSEFPELGVIGDMLASKDFGSRVSTLVVQQQPPGRSGFN